MTTTSCIPPASSTAPSTRCKHGARYVYLVDVLQRISQHPTKDVIELTPRVWKERFGSNPMKSDLDLVKNSSN